MQVLKFIKRVFVLYSVGFFTGHLLILVSGMLSNHEYKPDSPYILAAFFTVAALLSDFFKKKKSRPDHDLGQHQRATETA